MKTEQILLKLRYLIAIILLPFAFIACSNVDEYATTNDLPIHLGTGEVIRTKAASIGTQLPEGEKIGVYFSEDVTGTPSVTYESNLLYTSDGNGGLSGKMQYFPTNNGIKISAYHPYNEDLADEYTFTVLPDQTTDASVYASDLLYCPEFTQARTTEMIKLTFGHKLSQFVYELSSGAGEPDLTDAEVTLLGVNTSVTFNRTTGVIGDASNPQDVTLNGDGNGGIVVPQTIPAGTRLVKIALKDGSEMFYTSESAITLEPNKSFKLKLRVNKNETVGIGTEVGEWGYGGEDTGDANEENPRKLLPVEIVYRDSIDGGSMLFEFEYDTSNRMVAYSVSPKDDYEEFIHTRKQTFEYDGDKLIKWTSLSERPVHKDITNFTYKDDKTILMSTVREYVDDPAISNTIISDSNVINNRGQLVYSKNTRDDTTDVIETNVSFDSQNRISNVSMKSFSATGGFRYDEYDNKNGIFKEVNLPEWFLIFYMTVIEKHKIKFSKDNNPCFLIGASPSTKANTRYVYNDAGYPVEMWNIEKNILIAKITYKEYSN